MIHNGVELQGMTHDGVEVQTWTHNGVEVYSASKPWIAYNAVSGQMVANPPASAPPKYSGSNLASAAGAYMWQMPTTNTSHYISSKNVDGTQYIPTQGCKYVDVMVRTDINNRNILTITGMKNDGTETTILNYSIPKYNDNTNNIVDGVTLGNKYPHFVTNIDVSGYKKVKILTKSGATDGNGYIGYGLTRFHN